MIRQSPGGRRMANNLKQEQFTDISRFIYNWNLKYVAHINVPRKLCLFLLNHQRFAQLGLRGRKFVASMSNMSPFLRSIRSYLCSPHIKSKTLVLKGCNEHSRYLVREISRRMLGDSSLTLHKVQHGKVVFEIIKDHDGRAVAVLEMRTRRQNKSSISYNIRPMRWLEAQIR